jgi:hypothetical protein
MREALSNLRISFLKLLIVLFKVTPPKVGIITDIGNIFLMIN